MTAANPSKIGYQGRPGAYSELAALDFFGSSAEILNYQSFEEVFKLVENETLDHGIIPLENSLAGSILENYDHLIKYKVVITGETKLRVRHNLLGTMDSSIDTIKKIMSHPQALLQCEKTLKALGDFELIPFFDTAGAAEKVASLKDPTIAAIASDLAAKTYPVKVIKSALESNHENYTRFITISTKKADIRSDQNCKTSVVYSLKNIPGALFKSLSAFATRDIDLLKIESRPIQGSPFKYQFFVDFKEDLKSESSKNALRHLKEIGERVKILGTYNYES